MDEEADLRVSPGKARRSARRTHSSKPQQTVARADSAPTPLASEANSIAGSEVLLVLAISAAVQAWTPPTKSLQIRASDDPLCNAARVGPVDNFAVFG